MEFYAGDQRLALELQSFALPRLAAAAFEDPAQDKSAELRFVARLPAKPAPLDDALAALAALDLPDRPEPLWPYLHVRVQLSGPEPGLRARIEEAIAGKPLRLARIETATLRGALPDAAPALSVDELNALKPEAFFLRLYQHRFGCDAPPELMAAFGELLDTPAAEGAA